MLVLITVVLFIIFLVFAVKATHELILWFKERHGKER